MLAVLSFFVFFGRYSRSSKAETPVEPSKDVLDRGSSS